MATWAQRRDERRATRSLYQALYERGLLKPNRLDGTTSARAVPPAPTGRMCIIMRKDGSLIGNNEGEAVYFFGGRGNSAGTISSPSYRATKFTEEVGRDMLARDYTLTMMFVGR